MNAIAYIHEDLHWGHELLGLVLQDATPEQLAWAPGGIANPLGATYAHAVSAEDGVVQQILRGQPPLFETDWKDRTGISEPQFHSDFDWARRVRIDLPQLRKYAAAVFDHTDAHLATLSDGDLDTELDLSDMGYGTRTIAWAYSALIVSHLNNMIGEISVLKGLQGARGYPW